MKRDRELKRKEQDLANVKAQVIEAQQAHSAKVRAPRDAYRESHNRYPVDSGRLKDKADKLREHQSEIEAEIIMLRADTERLAEIEACNVALFAKRAEITAEMDELRAEIVTFNMGGQVFLGGDPVKLAKEYQAILDKLELLKDASDAIVLGFAWGGKL